MTESVPGGPNGEPRRAGARAEDGPTPPAKATIEEVARRAGVSVATVSRALRDLPYVAERTKLRVREVAAELNYVADPNASRLASGRSRSIGLIAPPFGTWYAAQAIAGVEEVLSAAGYDLLISSVRTPRHRKVFLEGGLALTQRVDGLVLVDFFAGEDAVGRLQAFGRPIVAMGERLDGISSLSIDNRAAATVATRHLLSGGHQRIGLVGGEREGSPPSPVPGDRRLGFLAALADAGRSHDRAQELEGGFTVEGGREAMHALLSAAEPPDAVFCMSDEMAFGALQAIRERGLRAPDDVAVVGFDDHPIAAAFGLTTMAQPVHDMGRRAAELLLEHLLDPAMAPVSEHVETRLLVRETAPHVLPAGSR